MLSLQDVVYSIVFYAGQRLGSYVSYTVTSVGTRSLNNFPQRNHANTTLTAIAMLVIDALSATTPNLLYPTIRGMTCKPKTPTRTNIHIIAVSN